MTTINCRGVLVDLTEPIVMGILNITPDSFSDGGKYVTVDAALAHAGQMIAAGATIIDVGGASSRPGAVTVDVQEETDRVVPVIRAIHEQFPDILISIDTWRAEVARAAVNAGACIINDISAGLLDDNMFAVMAELNVPVILMHMKGTPETMQKSPRYDDVVTEVLDFLMERVSTLQALGVKDIIVDPGFGFGKTLAHNYELLKRMGEIGAVIQRPVLAGISRKSMVYKLLGIDPADALNGTAALHMVALQQGAKILRVHDVKETVEVVRLWKALRSGEV